MSQNDVCVEWYEWFINHHISPTNMWCDGSVYLQIQKYGM